MTPKKIDYWDLEDVEQLNYDDKDEAIEAILDEYPTDPDTITLCGYRRMKITESKESIADDILERLLDHLDQEYGGEDYTEITEDMKKIAKEFVDKFMPLYPVYRCEIVCRETIDVKKWRAENGDKK
jgi:hypothetical protein